MSKKWAIGAACTGALAYAMWDGKKVSERKNNSRLTKGKRFVIVGGGFAGTGAATELASLLEPGESDPEIILIDKRDYLLFTPMLTEAVGASIEPHHIIVPLESFSRRVQFVKGAVKNIDLAARRVEFEDPHLQPITADYLIVALGATSNYHDVPGAEKAAFTLKSLDDAYGIRENALGMVESAARTTDEADRKAKLTFLVAGGGYTGVEGIAALNDMVKAEVAKHDALRDTPVQMIIAEPMDRLMSEVTEDLASYSQKQLEKAGVRVILKAGIKSVDGDQVELTNGERIRAGTFIWAAGVRANPLVSQLGAATGKAKSIKVGGTFAVSGFPNVWAIGDCAEVPKPNGSGTYGATAQNATREGTLVAQNVLRVIHGEEPKRFKYTPIGELALVGKQKGVARIYGFNFSGLIAYLMWRGIYLAKMPSMAQRLRVLGDWSLDTMLGETAEYRKVPAAPPTTPKEAPVAKKRGGRPKKQVSAKAPARASSGN